MGLSVDTTIHTVLIPENQDALIGKIGVMWTGLEYGYQRDLWIMNGVLVNGTDTELVLPAICGQVDLKLIRDTTPLTSGDWCGLKPFDLAVIPPRSIYRFSIPGETGRKYTVALETRDLQIKSEEITIDRWFDDPNQTRTFTQDPVDPDFKFGKLFIGYTKTNGTRTAK